MSFKDVQGQVRAVTTLKGYMAKRRLPHALLFSGPQDSGQRQVAIELAKAVLCEALSEAFETCEHCAQCRLMNQASHPDFEIIEPEEDGQVIKVDRIRELIAKTNLKPFQACAKVYVIDHAECMNEIAQNALLKTLEEPAASTHIILISYANERVLLTIRSRTQLVQFAPAKSDVAPDAEVEAIRYEMLSYLTGNAGWKTAETATLERVDVLRILDLLCADLRDMLVMQIGAEEVLGFTNDKPLKERAMTVMSETEIMRKISVLSEFKEKISESVNMKLALSVLKDELTPFSKVGA